ncbi:MAG: hypothetical protein MUF54_01570 [Polyangiaceae bacterium]|jgi:hypothetical protein|nr:hypothetical protein [Polyangiaceae bacterium]
MRKRSVPASAPQRDDLEAALATMSADDLREVVRAMLLELDEKAHSRVMSSLIDRAARGGTGWAPAALGGDEVAEVLAFAKAAKRAGQADPSEVDELLRRGSAAFLGKDYHAAHRIFGALLPPIGDGEIDLGQHEMIDEVLGTDTAECAAQHVVSAYMITAPAKRAEAVRTAIDEVQSVGNFREPLGELERAAVEPLPGFHDFLPQWRALIVPKPSNERNRDWDTQEDRWLREVVQRLEGSDGLAKVARSTRRAEDLRAWCKSLVDARDWKSALAAFEEAAELVADKDRARGEFLDGAALAAQSLGRKDLPARLGEAWCAGPTMLRLRRWVGSSSSKAVLAKRAAEALKVCPKQAARQCAFLHVLEHDFALAAKLLAAAPGLGWSNEEHPGHLLFPLFLRLLGGKRKRASATTDLPSLRGMDEMLETMTADPEAPRLIAPEIEELLVRAGVETISDSTARATTLAAMRKAAENRIAGVTEQKRRRYYGHAAELVATCIACDATGETARWAAALKAKHNRFPALRSELDRAMRAL